MTPNIVVTSQTELYQLISQAVSEALANQDRQPQNEKKSEYLSLKQACAYLHIAPQTMYALTSKRKIKFIKAFKSLLFTQADLDEYLAMNRKETKHSILNSQNLGKKKEVKHAA